MPRISAQEVDDVYDASAETSQVSKLIRVRETRQKGAGRGNRRQEIPSTPLSTSKTLATKRIHVQDVRRSDQVQKRASPKRMESLKDAKAKSTRQSDFTKHVLADDSSGHGIGAQKTSQCAIDTTADLNAYHDVASHDQKVRKGTAVKVSTLPLLNPGQQAQLIAWPASNENLAANHLQFPLGEYIDCSDAGVEEGIRPVVNRRLGDAADKLVSALHGNHVDGAYDMRADSMLDEMEHLLAGTMTTNPLSNATITVTTKDKVGISQRNVYTLAERVAEFQTIIKAHEECMARLSKEHSALVDQIRNFVSQELEIRSAESEQEAAAEVVQALESEIARLGEVELADLEAEIEKEKVHLRKVEALLRSEI